MDDNRFDQWTKISAVHRSRRSVLKMLGSAIFALGLGRSVEAAPQQVDTITAQTTQISTSQLSPRQIVEQYYLAISTYNYKAAYELFNTAMQQAQGSFQQFVQGFTETAYARVNITGDQPHDGHTDVSVVITAWHNDGSIHQFSGRYAIGRENGRLLIIDAAIVQDATPTNELPLCRVQDLNAQLAPWQGAAGSRVTSLRVTNNGTQSCLAAGVPHIQFYDRNGLLLGSQSEQTQPMTMVQLAPRRTAVADIRWTNWCGDVPVAPFRVNIAIPGDTARFNLQNAKLSVPPCLGSGESSLLGVKAFRTA